MSDVEVRVGQNLIALLTLSTLVDTGGAEADDLRDLTDEITSNPQEASLTIAGLLGFIAGLIPNPPEEFIKVLQNIAPTVYELEEN